jgi:multidrug resistance efflux pump
VQEQKRASDQRDPVETRRTSTARLVRFIYAAGIIGLILALAWHFGRDIFFIEGSGRVSAKTYVLSRPYNTHIRTINVVPGSKVKVGDIVAEFDSFQIDQYISDLVIAISVQTNKEADYQIRLTSSNAAMSTETKRSDFAASSVKRMERLPQGMFSNQDRIPFYREQAVAKHDLATSLAEASEIKAQLDRLSNNTALLNERISKITHEFDDGKLRATVDGIIGSKISRTGDTILTGDNIAEIFDTSEIYVDWEMPLRRFIEPKVGDKVYITSGFNNLEGEIAEIFPISTPLGAEKKAIYSTTPQGQTVRIKGVELRKLALDSYVAVRLNYTTAMDTFFLAFQNLFKKNDRNS